MGRGSLLKNHGKSSWQNSIVVKDFTGNLLLDTSFAPNNFLVDEAHKRIYGLQYGNAGRMILNLSLDTIYKCDSCSISTSSRKLWMMQSYEEEGIYFVKHYNKVKSGSSGKMSIIDHNGHILLDRKYVTRIYDLKLNERYSNKEMFSSDFTFSFDNYYLKSIYEQLYKR